MKQIIIISMIIAFSVTAFTLWQKEHQLDRQQELHLAKLRICYDYNPSNGDFVWRHENCKAFEKEILEMKDFNYLK